MDRREFIRKSIGGSIVAGSALALGSYGKAVRSDAGTTCRVRTIWWRSKGGEPDAMFDSAIQVMGGMATFVKKGQKVLVKPNIGWDVTPERGGNTNPKLVSRLIQHCLNAGAKEVYVFDHTCEHWIKTYKNSGIERAVKDAGGKIVSGDSESYYHEVDIPKGKRLTKAKVHELLLGADVFINVPILKHHSSSRVTIGLKNGMGVVWDRGYWHSNDLHQCIADFGTYRKPDLTVVDAYYVVETERTARCFAERRRYDEVPDRFYRSGGRRCRGGEDLRCRPEGYSAYRVRGADGAREDGSRNAEHQEDNTVSG